MLAERRAIDIESAFKILRNHARNHNELLADVARSVVDGRLGAAALDPL